MCVVCGGMWLGMVRWFMVFINVMVMVSLLYFCVVKCWIMVW